MMNAIGLSRSRREPRSLPLRSPPGGFAVSLIVVFLAAISSSAAIGAPRVTIKVATLAPEGSPWMQAFRAMNKEIMGKTGGRVRFKAYPGGVMGDEKDVMRKIRIGQLHGAGFTGLGTGLIFADTLVVSSPLLVRDHEEVDYVLEQMGDYFRAGMERAGYVVLGWQEVGFIYVFSKQPIRTMAELRQRRIWMWSDDPVAPVALKAARVAPIPLALPDVLMALQTDMLDTVYTSPLGVIVMQWFTRVKYMTDCPLSYAIGGLLVTKKQFNRIPAEMRPPVRDICSRHMKVLQAKARKDNLEAVNVLKKRGIQVVTLTPEARSELEQICLDASRGLAGTVFSARAFDMIQEHLATFRRSRKKQP